MVGLSGRRSSICEELQPRDDQCQQRRRRLNRGSSCSAGSWGAVILVIMSAWPDDCWRPRGRLGQLPLVWQPGEHWLYHTPSDVLGVLVARAAEQPFAEFLGERLFGPLGMVDTGFAVKGGQ